MQVVDTDQSMAVSLRAQLQMQGMDTDQSVAVSPRAQKTRAAANRGTCEKQLQGGPQRDLDATTISDSPSVSI